MTLQQLQQVITIAESKSMNEAAKKLFVSQPNLSSVVREVGRRPELHFLFVLTEAL